MSASNPSISPRARVASPLPPIPGESSRAGIARRARRRGSPSLPRVDEPTRRGEKKIITRACLPLALRRGWSPRAMHAHLTCTNKSRGSRCVIFSRDVVPSKIKRGPGRGVCTRTRGSRGPKRGEDPGGRAERVGRVERQRG